MKTFIFNWNQMQKYRTPTIRNTSITAKNAQMATAIFIKEFGNLNKNNINYIQEINPITKENIGEPIIPQDGTTLLPIKET